MPPSSSSHHLYGRHPLLPLWSTCDLSRWLTAWRNSSRLSFHSSGRWWHGGDLGALLFSRHGGRALQPPMEEELRALLSFLRQMAARWGPRCPHVQPRLRMSSELSSPCRCRWRRGRDLGALLFSSHGGRARGYPLLPKADGGTVGTSTPPLPRVSWWI